MRAARDWPDDLPSNGGNTLVVAGLDACLDLLAPADADSWLGNELKPGNPLIPGRILRRGRAGLLAARRASAASRLHMATDAVRWRCSAPHADQQIDFGRILWGEAREYPQEICHARRRQARLGLFHLRIT